MMIVMVVMMLVFAVVTWISHDDNNKDAADKDGS